MLARLTPVAVALALCAAACADLKVTTKRLGQSKKGFYEATASYPVFTGAGAVVKLANAQVAQQAKSDYDRFVGDAKQGSRELGRPTMAWAYESKAIVALANETLVSLYFDRYEFSGGAHPNTFQLPLNFGLVDGEAKRLKLGDLVKPGSAGTILSQIVRPRLNNAKRIRGGDPVDSIEASLADSFVITRAGLTWLFPTYSVGPYVEGSYEVKVPYSDLAPYLVSGGPLASVRP